MCSCWACSRILTTEGIEGVHRNSACCAVLVGFYALTTLPLRMQEVHTRIRLVVAPTRACTGRRFTFQRRLVTLWAWLMRFPDCGFLPQISHCCAMSAIHPFTGFKRSIHSTGFRPRRQFAQIEPEKVNWLRALKQN